MTSPPERLWRAFPWDPEAETGRPFSPSYVHPAQGQGRFDMPGAPGGVLYLAETPEHAVAELIQQYRGRRLAANHLRVAGHSLALVSVHLPDPVRSDIIDLCDPEVLVRIRIRPDQLASRDRHLTQRIAAEIHANDKAGLRWWSALTGDWHTVVVFRDRIRSARPRYGTPEPLALDHAAVREATAALGIPVR